jgi:tetratricopeptide (TPR) repeat protein
VFLRYAIRRDTKVANAYVACAMLLMQAGREQAVQAAPLLEKAFALTTNRLLKKNLILTRASCQWLMGNTDQAIALLEQMRKDYEYVNDKVYSTLGFLYFLKGDDAQAQALSQKALDDNPNAHSAWDNLGQIYYKRGEFEQAKQAFDRALECKADLPDSLYHMGLIARREGDEGRARAYFDKALACKITGFNTVTRAQIEQAAGGL